MGVNNFYIWILVGSMAYSNGNPIYEKWNLGRFEESFAKELSLQSRIAKSFGSIPQIKSQFQPDNYQFNAAMMDRSNGPILGSMDRSIHPGSIDQGLIDRGPIDQGSIDQGPIDQGSIDQGPIDQGSNCQYNCGKWIKVSQKDSDEDDDSWESVFSLRTLGFSNALEDLYNLGKKKESLPSATPMDNAPKKPVYDQAKLENLARIIHTMAQTQAIRDQAIRVQSIGPIGPIGPKTNFMTRSVTNAMGKIFKKMREPTIEVTNDHAKTKVNAKALINDLKLPRPLFSMANMYLV